MLPLLIGADSPIGVGVSYSQAETNYWCEGQNALFISHSKSQKLLESVPNINVNLETLSCFIQALGELTSIITVHALVIYVCSLTS